MTYQRFYGHGFHTCKGFTLIEILVVMAIIGMLAVMVAPNIFNQQAGAQRDAALSQIAALEAALDTHRLDVGVYPDSLEGLRENSDGRASWNGPICEERCLWIRGGLSTFMNPAVGGSHYSRMVLTERSVVRVMTPISVSSREYFEVFSLQ